jgi:hypothetical protein
MEHEWLSALAQLPVVLDTSELERRSETLGVELRRILHDILDELVEKLPMNLSGRGEGGGGHRLSDGIGRPP